MNPRHRDRVAFLRVCSGRLVRDMQVEHARLGTSLRLSRVYRFFGRERETVPEAFAGDVIGLVSPSHLAIGDTLFAGTRVCFPPIPAFPPERFATVRPTDGGRKGFRSAVNQLAEEGLVQVFTRSNDSPHPIVGVVGALQFDVVQARMAAEYGIPCEIEPLPHVAARWPVPLRADAPPISLPYSGALAVTDRQGHDVLLFATAYGLEDCIERNPAISFLESR
jgi:peptide chain release factor 3